MLRQSLKNFLKTLPVSFNTQLALQKMNFINESQENEFHKRLRNELIMLPIPKAKFFDRKVPSGVNREDFKDEIIEKQTHVLQSAISRVSLRVSSRVSLRVSPSVPNRDLSESKKLKNTIKLVHQSAMDPKGILMLNSIREIFDLLGLDFESMQFVPEKFDTKRSIIDAINNQRKCPAIVGAKFDFSTGAVDAHVMVAAGVKTETVQHGSSSKQQYFIQCKNSYRDDPNQSGKFHHRYRG